MLTLCHRKYWMIYETVTCKIDVHYFLVVFAVIKHGLICEKEAQFYNAWICCWLWAGTVLQKRSTTLFRLKPEKCWSDSVMQKWGIPLFAWGLQWLWMCSVLQKGCAPSIKTDNCRVPLFHHFAVSVLHRLNCIKDEIRTRRTFHHIQWRIEIRWPWFW